MIKRIIRAFLFDGELGRLDLLVALAATAIMLKFLLYIIAPTMIVAVDGGATLLFILVGVLVFAATIPPVVGRLKDIDWPSALAGGVAIPIIPLVFFWCHMTTEGVFAAKPPPRYLGITV